MLVSSQKWEESCGFCLPHWVGEETRRQKALSNYEELFRSWGLRWCPFSHEMSMKVTAGQHGKWHLDMLTEPPISPSQKPPRTLAPRTPHSTLPPHGSWTQGTNQQTGSTSSPRRHLCRPYPAWRSELVTLDPCCHRRPHPTFLAGGHLAPCDHHSLGLRQSRLGSPLCLA